MAEPQLALGEDRVGVCASLPLLCRLDADGLLQGLDAAGEVAFLHQDMRDVEEVGGLVVPADGVATVVGLGQGRLRFPEPGVGGVPVTDHGGGMGLLAAEEGDQARAGGRGRLSCGVGPLQRQPAVTEVGRLK